MSLSRPIPIAHYHKYILNICILKCLINLSEIIDLQHPSFIKPLESFLPNSATTLYYRVDIQIS